MTTDRDTLLDEARRLFIENRLVKAEMACRRLLEDDPRNAEALHLLGLVTYQYSGIEDALSQIDQAIAIAPTNPSYHNSRGSLLFQAERFAEALPSFEAAVAHGGTIAEPHLNLGNTLHALSRYQEAEASFRRMLTLVPNHPKGHKCLGTVLKDLGRLDEAIASFRAALALAPDYLDVKYSLADALFSQLALEEAETLFRQVSEEAPQFVPALVGLGQVLYNQRRMDEAVEVLERARALDPQGLAVDYAHRLACCALIAPWHLPMLNDHERNQAYQAALERAVTPDSLVLEIGTGSGLVAMMAAKAGARKVVTCEISRILARVATETVARNQLADRVTVVPKISTQLRVGEGEELPEKADVLVSELINVGLLAPGLFQTLRHAMTELVKPGARVIPAGARVWGQLVQCDELARINPIRTISGFDLTAFDRFRPPGYAQIDLANDPHRPLCAAFSALDFDFLGPMPDTGRVELTVTVTEEGLCHGVVFWFDLFMDEKITYSSASRARANHWKQAIHFFPAPIAVSAGDALTVVASFDNTRISFSVAESGVAG